MIKEYGAENLLSGKLLEYFDFLVMNVPWFNGVNAESQQSVAGLASQHNCKAALRELEKCLVQEYKEVIVIEEDSRLPKHRRCYLMEEGDDE